MLNFPAKISQPDTHTYSAKLKGVGVCKISKKTKPPAQRILQLHRTNMKLTFLTTILILLILTVSFAQTSAVKRKPVGKLSGLVLDEGDARVVNVKIIIKGKKFRRVIKSNDEGQFEIWLPKGRYEIRVPEENGWYGSKHKQLHIIPQKTVKHNFVLRGIRQDVNHP
jgi:hypothetical protein